MTKQSSLFEEIPERKIILQVGMASHNRVSEGKDEWLTPPEIIESLGEFDLDPCSPNNRPWPTAKKHYNKKENGLIQSWAGRVWLNPPYGSETEHWMKRLSEHGNGIALIFVRTETATWFDWIWPKSDGILFMRRRLNFHHVDGRKALHNGGAPNALIAYGQANVKALRETKIEGHYITP